MAKLSADDAKALKGIHARSKKSHGGKSLGRAAELATLRRNKARHPKKAGGIGTPATSKGPRRGELRSSGTPKRGAGASTGHTAPNKPLPLRKPAPKPAGMAKPTASTGKASQRAPIDYSKQLGSPQPPKGPTVIPLRKPGASAGGQLQGNGAGPAKPPTPKPYSGGQIGSVTGGSTKAQPFSGALKATKPVKPKRSAK